MYKEFNNKRILVTGGTGSIGSCIVRELLKYRPRQVRIFSRDEGRQFALASELGFNTPINFLIGDIRDKERLGVAMEDIDIVFHAGALKHVAACENNPFEALKTNVLGTQNVIECALASGVSKVIAVSTDKAIDPSSVMGCTKLLAEKMIMATSLYKGTKKTRFCVVRFGNVLGSRGSVLPLFIQQARKGGPLTITDPRMTRFFMTIPQAVNLIFQSSKMMKDREIFVLKMSGAKIGDLAQAVIEIVQEESATSKKIPIKTIGKKPGEKMHEKLLTQEEAQSALETKDMFIILPDRHFERGNPKPHIYPHYPHARKKRGDEEYCSQNQAQLSSEQLKSMIRNAIID